MAKDDTGLLGEIVGQLKQLNASSKRDMLREAEAAARAEKLQKVSETQADFSGIAVDDQKDFQRRFLAGQASAIVNENQRLEPARKRALETSKGTRAAVEKDAIIQSNMYNLSQANVSYLQDISDHLYTIGVLLTDKLTEISKWGSLNRLTLGHIQNKTTSMVNALHMLTAEIGPKSISVHDASTQESIGEVLSSDKKRNDELDKQRNFDKRELSEAKREAINWARAATAGIKEGRRGQGWDDELDEEGSIWTTAKDKGTTALSTIMLLKANAIWRWMGFGKGNIGFKAAMGNKFKALGSKIFPKGKFKLSGKQVGMSKNPRMWPILLATIVASSFLSASSDALAEPEGEGPAGSETDSDAIAAATTGSDGVTPMGVLNTALWASILTPAKIKARIANAVNTRTMKLFENAKPNTLRARMWATRTIPGSPFAKFAARGALRFMGPWGLAAWAVWTIVDWQMGENEKALRLHELELLDIQDIQSEEAMEDFIANDARWKNYINQEGEGLGGGRGGQLAGMSIRDARRREAVKSLLKNRTEQEIPYLKKLLIEEGGWTEQTLNSILSELNISKRQADWAASHKVNYPEGFWKAKAPAKEKWRLENIPGWAETVRAREIEEAAFGGKLLGQDRLAMNDNSITVGSADTNTSSVVNLFVARHHVKDNVNFQTLSSLRGD